MPPGTVARSRRRRGDSQPSSDKQARSGEGHLYHCNYCQKDISHVVRVKCAVCPDFDLCLECFSVGVELLPHRNDHAYRLVDNLSFPLYEPDWGADEELLLLEAVDMFGLGNWQAVSNHIGSKSAMACQSHYLRIWVESPNYPAPHVLPQMAGLDPLQVAREKRAAALARVGQRRQPAAPSASSLTPEASTALGVGQTPATTETPAAPGATLGVAERPDALGRDPAAVGDAAPSEPPGASVPPPVPSADQTQPARKKQRTETKPEAPASKTHGEQAGTTAEGTSERRPAPPQPQVQVSQRGLPGEVAVTPAGIPISAHASGETAGKSLPDGSAAGLGHIPIGIPFNVKVGLQQAELTGYHPKRKEFEPEYDNDAESLIADLDFRDEDTEEETAEKLQLIHVYNERLTRREEARKFVIERNILNMRRQQALERKQAPSERQLHAKLRPLARYQEPEDHARLVDGMVVEHHLRSRISELKALREAGVRTFAEAETREAESRHREAEAAAAAQPSGSAQDLSFTTPLPLRRPEDGSGSQGSGILPTHSSFTRAWEREKEKEGRPSAGAGQATANGPALPGLSHEGPRAANALASWRARRGCQLDITNLPGTEFLTAQERDLWRLRFAALPLSPCCLQQCSAS
ncbi:hypothetical protein WJX84_008443 [Apatococcus fuscideae]|uniref:Transcriptional adapter n=1 Tax=Apatococcus fuscideae TaxID=2026836 RepID=A0AAW1SVC2_9CHLO